jgi:hypothetical protein
MKTPERNQRNIDLPLRNNRELKSSKLAKNQQGANTSKRLILHSLVNNKHQKGNRFSSMIGSCILETCKWVHIKII